MNLKFLILGIVSLVLIPVVIALYVWKIKREKKAKVDFKLEKRVVRNQEIFEFWGHVVYLFIIFTLIVMTLVFIPIGIG